MERTIKTTGAPDAQSDQEAGTLSVVVAPDVINTSERHPSTSLLAPIARILAARGAYRRALTVWA